MISHCKMAIKVILVLKMLRISYVFGDTEGN